MMNIRNAHYNDAGGIDLELEHPDFGWIPFTATHDDPEEHGRAIFEAGVAGEYPVEGTLVVPERDGEDDDE
jgi:hypothetical protein